MGWLSGTVALISGAARGQGREHAVRLASEGADIIGFDICHDLAGVTYGLGTEADLEQTAEAVEALGRKVVMGAVDVQDLAAVEEFVGGAVQQLGRLDIVVANAGIGAFDGMAHEVSEAAWQQMISVNLTGVWHTARAGIPHLLAGSRGGSVILTSSAAGLQAYPGLAHYVSAKHGVVGLMKALAVELGPAGIRVNSVHPTQVRTPMITNDETLKLFVPDKEDATWDDFAAVSQGMHLLPTPWVEPEDVANLVAFLASDQARFITGAAIPVDAGAVLK
jgi:SDR family mycofactocin-dependent oxidoreductase